MTRIKSFTIFEILISLSIFAAILSIFSLSFSNFKKREKNSYFIEYHQMILKIEDRYGKTEWSDKDQKIRFLTNGHEDTYSYFRFKNASVQMTTSEGGTMPLIDNVKRFKIFSINDRLNILVEFLDGTTFQNRLMIKKRRTDVLPK